MKIHTTVSSTMTSKQATFYQMTSGSPRLQISAWLTSFLKIRRMSTPVRLVPRDAWLQEYVMHEHLSVKADVFSFGVLVLELISCQRNLLDWAYKLYKKGKSLEILDSVLASTTVTEQVAMCIQIGLLCTQCDPTLRPTMHRVVVIVSKKPSNLDELTRPGVPGSRYRRSRGPGALSSTTGTSGESNTSNSSFNTNTGTGTTSMSQQRTSTNSLPQHKTGSTLRSPGLDSRGKRPIE